MLMVTLSLVIAVWLGTFGMLRYCLPLFPDAATTFRPAIITLAVIGMLYAFYVKPVIKRRRQERVWAEVENPQLELRPGMRGTLTIAVSR